jgi:hypothetical protein
MLAYVLDGIRCWEAVDDGDAGQRRAGATTATAAGDFNALMLGAFPDVEKRVSSGDSIGR